MYNITGYRPYNGAKKKTTYNFELVLYDITPHEKPPTDPSFSTSNPCVMIQLRRPYRWQVKFQLEEEGDEREEISFDIIFPDEFCAWFSTPLDRILSDDNDEEHYISDLLQRYCGAHLESCECDYLQSWISYFCHFIVTA